jgi:hypothetical protein
MIKKVENNGPDLRTESYERAQDRPDKPLRF